MAFTQKSHLNYHIKRNACKTYTYFCKYCEKGFTTSNSMYRHMKHNCATKKEVTEKAVDLEENIKHLQDENESLKRLI
jgi:hypothetical protein